MKIEPLDKECIVVAHQEEIGVYVTVSGYVVIRQQHEMEDPSLVMIAPGNVDAVINALKEHKDFAEKTRREYIDGEDDDAS